MGEDEARDRTTRLVAESARGDASAKNELVRLLYGELRKIARSQRRRHGYRNETLHTTALINEMYLKLGTDVGDKGRRYFLGAAAESMKQVLIEDARRKMELKRGCGAPHENYEDTVAGPERCLDEILSVHQTLDELRGARPRTAEVVELHWFVGLGKEEIASLLGVSLSTVRRDLETGLRRLAVGLGA
jgi:RNA polymerase sigma factor (TIGR02999 family)